jgi:hypothetical protein
MTVWIKAFAADPRVKSAIRTAVIVIVGVALERLGIVGALSGTLPVV